MNENPEYKLDIAGHTDNSGNSAKNQSCQKTELMLSRTTLPTKGVDTSRMTASGFGDNANLLQQQDQGWKGFEPPCCI